MSLNFVFNIKTLRFDEDYVPSNLTRLTTNFANLARGAGRQENLRKTLQMINNRCNELATWDNPDSQRYSVEVDILSSNMRFADTDKEFPFLEMLKTTLVDHKNNQRIAGIVGNSFSSFVRDYDFSIVLAKYNKGRSEFAAPEDFGDLHGKLFKAFVNSNCYAEKFNKKPVFCLSVATSKTYHITDNYHPILGMEYQPSDLSATDKYFAKMGLTVRYFMPKNSAAPLAFYYFGDLLNDYTDLELISTISTMEVFQKIYRPEIYNANSRAGKIYQPSLTYTDYSVTQIDYDREERNQLALEQGQFIEEVFIQPYKTKIANWVANFTL